MGNVVKAVFGKNTKEIKTEPLFQYDYGQILIIEGITLPTAYQVHFSNEPYGASTTSIGGADGVEIPDAYLQTGADVYAWLFLQTGESDGRTVAMIRIPVKARAEITNDEPTPVQQGEIDQLIAALNDAVEAAEDSAEDAEDAAEDSADSAEDAEAWAQGTRGGVPVGSTDPAYQKNSKYYSEQAAQYDPDAKIDKVPAATTGNFASFTSGGGLQDSGKKASDFLTEHQDISGKANLTVIAPTFAEGTANDAGSFVTYTDGKVYFLEDGHTAGTSWANTTKAETNIAAEIKQQKSDILPFPKVAAAGDVGKVLKLKTVEDGKPKEYEYGTSTTDPSAIAQAVDDWCDENITNPSSPPLDRSLTGSSSAAPADMVGDMDTDLEMQTVTVDLLRNATHTSGKKIDADGYIQSVSTYDIYEIDHDGSYSKFDAVLYSSSNYQLRAMTFHNENGVPLETDQFINTSGDYKSEFTDKTIPAGTKKIYLSYRNSMGPISASYKIRKSNRITEIEGDIRTLSIFPVSSKNLVDESKKVVGLIYEVNGTLNDTFTTHKATDYIEIEPNEIYTISAYFKDTGYPNIEGLRYAFYANDKTFISGYKPEGAWSTFRTPSTAKYIRFSMLQTNNEKWQLEKRPFATKYVPYDTIEYNDESDEMFMNFPSKVYAVTGLEYNLYMFNVRPERIENEFKSTYVMPTITGMRRFGRFIRLIGSNTSTTTRVIGAESKNLTKYGYKLFSMIVKDPANLDNVSVLVLGDSTTANGYVVQYLHEFSGAENKVTTLGTLGTAPYKHEGRTGWRLEDYFNTSDNNPFYNPETETFDAGYYFTQTGVAQPDIFIVNLGINDMHYNSKTPYEAKQHAAEFVANIKDVITSVKGVSSSIKVAICLTIPPNVNPESFGTAGINSIDYDNYRIANLVLCEALINAFDYRENEGIYLIPINACLDTKYNMPTETGYPNSRSTEQITIPTTAANVHPNTAGYHQIADEMFAFICSLYAT